MAASRLPAPARLVQAYYWLTPVFLFVSWRYGFDVRVPFLDSMPVARAAYYAVMFACAGLVFWRPELTALVGRAEGTFSIIVLILTTWGAYFSMFDAAAGDGPFENPFTRESVTSLTLSAVVLSASLMSHEIQARTERSVVAH